MSEMGVEDVYEGDPDKVDKSVNEVQDDGLDDVEEDNE